ncbi:hypothetical protein BAUCODRAFT_72815 [Baudoinia panamericana UAMH 10762]|uniref:RmlD-like substrate binding domain-containing protein n=1 Tax=Baudoinia panamericana (strain UAMH 10762) TaxID=717646 RepID=M2N862_BAUPA|nr:uncharacterized protein BAUCODRAFT_72815 [Baudoinia panamericana UAMH 10762]EMC95289.1 hypothetical protein BAUCODRAFT_72815 [Baudoinia panamericana UAMH 10762]
MDGFNGHRPCRYLIWGKGGWVAGHLESLLRRQSKDVHVTGTRMEDQSEVCKVLDNVKPTHVINCAGKNGRPNVDWCEDNKIETIQANVLGTLTLANECFKRDIHNIVMATGCIYASDYTLDKTRLTSQPFIETDRANFEGSFYSYAKSRVEDILKVYPNILVLRLRMPVSDDLHPRNFVTKIMRYAHVVNVPNSNSILHDLLPLIVPLAESRVTGVLNFTNPGAISHNEVLTLYKEIVDPSYMWKNFTLDEQARVIKADRSNCELDCSKLMGLVKGFQGQGYDVNVPRIHEAYSNCFMRMKEGMQMREGATSPGA